MHLQIISRIQVFISFAIGLFAFIIRIPFILIYNVHKLAGTDPAAFWSFAEGIASGHGFRSTVEPWLADRPPVYSYFLAGVFRLFGEQETTVYIIQALIAAIATCLFCLIAVRVMGTVRGVFAGFVYGLFPDILIFTKEILTESIYLPLLVLLLSLLLLPNLKRFQFWQWLLTGLVLGILVLTRREAAFPTAVLILSLGCLRFQPSLKPMLGAFAIVAVTTMIVITPWVIRNWQRLGVPVLSSSGGYNFMVGNNPNANGKYSQPPDNWADQLMVLDELDRDKLAQKLSMDWIEEDPTRFFKLIPLKLGAFISPANNIFIDVADILMIPFYISALIRLVRQNDNWLITIIITLGLVLPTVLVSVIFLGGWRYRMPMVPGLLFLGAYGLPELWVTTIGARLSKSEKSAMFI